MTPRTLGDHPTQRVVSAADAARPETTGASSAFNWRGPGETPDKTSPAAAENPAPAPAPAAKTTPKAAPSSRLFNAGSPQFRLCQLLVEKGPQKRGQVLAALSGLTTNQVNGAIFNARAVSRINLVDGLCTLTDLGRAWVAAGGPAFKPGPTKPAYTLSPAAPAPTADTPAPLGLPVCGADDWKGTSAPAVDTSGNLSEEGIHVTVVALPRSPIAHAPNVRCFVDSNGCFSLFKADRSIELDAAEFAHVLHYLDRMADPLPA